MSPSAASFRDPSGICCVSGEHVLRALDAGSGAVLDDFLQTRTAREFTTRRHLVTSRRLEQAEAAELRESKHWGTLFTERVPEVVFQHERIPFRSYPYEWPPEMLWQAGHLTLELAMAALQEAYGLKDATPYNVLYRGCEPVFIDVASFERRRPDDPLWRPYAQFVRTFLLPLLAHRRWGVKMADIFVTHRDGIEPEDVYRMCSGLERLRPQTLSLVSIPTWLQSKAGTNSPQRYKDRSLKNSEQAQFIVESLFNRLRRGLESLKPLDQKKSAWSNYAETHTYTEAGFSAKRQFVEEVLTEFRPRRVLDAGANTGTFSFVAARAGAEVVAVDLDATCVGRIWQQARAEQLNVLPLVIDLSRPSPGLGWRNGECPAFLGRASGYFDCVLMLALVHHLLVTERIPLLEIFKLAAELTTSILMIEFIPPDDPMFQALTRGREALHTGFNRNVFEQALSAYFEVIRSQPLPGTGRQMYALKKSLCVCEPSR